MQSSPSLHLGEVRPDEGTSMDIDEEKEKNVREKIQENRVVIVSLFIAVIFITMGLIIYFTHSLYGQNWTIREWTGFGPYVTQRNNTTYIREFKTLWDLLELFIVPAILAIGLYLLNQSARRNEQRIAKDNREEDRQIAEDNRNQATLEAYFDKMTQLILEENLAKDAEWNDVDKEKLELVHTIAITRTLSVLRSVDGPRIRAVFQFLDDAQLDHIIDQIIKDKLVEIDWTNRNLTGLHLPKNTNLVAAKLQGVDLMRANLTEVYLIGANLIEANLAWANLTGAYLEGANLTGANLQESLLLEANLQWADLQGVENVTKEQLMEVDSLEDATMPDGKKYYNAWFEDYFNEEENKDKQVHES